MPYRLIALDLDGTLKASGQAISERVVGVVQHAIGAGVKVTMATGRMFQSTRPFAQQLGISLPIICYQGALIGDAASGDVLWHRTMPLPLARRVIEEVRTSGLHLNLFLNDEYFVEDANETAQRYSSVAKVPLHAVADLLHFLEREPTKIVAIGDEDKASTLVKHLQETFGPALSVCKTFPHFCEVGPPEATKSRALAWLAGELGIGQAETVAVGDSGNDVDMLRWAGLGGAVAGSAPEVIAAADLVATGGAGDGVIELIEDLLQAGVLRP